MPWIRPLALSMLLVSAPALSHAGDLTTRDIVELSRSGLGDEVLIALVDVDGGPFDLSPADLLDLKTEGLSDRVLAALVRAGRHRMPADDYPQDFIAPLAYSQTYTRDRYVTHTVAVPVPVYVPVYEHRASSSRRRDRPSERADESAVSTPGVRRGPVTADSIRHAPPGFHPGTVRSRTTAASDASAHTGSRASSTPGIARSTPSADRTPTPGVARSQRSSEP